MVGKSGLPHLGHARIRHRVRGLAGEAGSGTRRRRAADHAGARRRADRHVCVVDDRDGFAGRRALRHPVPQSGLVGARADDARAQVVLPHDAARRHVRRELRAVSRRPEEDEEYRRQAHRGRGGGRSVRHRSRRCRRSEREEGRLRRRDPRFVHGDDQRGQRRSAEGQSGGPRRDHAGVVSAGRAAVHARLQAAERRGQGDPGARCGLHRSGLRQDARRRRRRRCSPARSSRSTSSTAIRRCR